MINRGIDQFQEHASTAVRILSILIAKDEWVSPSTPPVFYHFRERTHEIFH